ncbi:MAG TPA: lysophospholipid acyltransferase family protein, partial [Phycisphaerae bacterium]|nr:lysophospholipid acyltransferase family protein [Phycisphaerae bacterium]
ISLLGTWFLRLWLGTLDVWVYFEGDDALPSRRKSRGLYLLWHECLLLSAQTYANQGFGMLISTHRDGDIIAQIMEFMGGTTFRGSSTRNGARAVRDMMTAHPGLHLAITPDGPKGPRHEVQMGAIFLASRMGIPIVPCAFAACRPKRIRNWDRTILPRPFSACRCVFLTPIEIPRRLSREQMEHYRLEVQQAVGDAQDRAEDLAQRQVTEGLISYSHARREKDLAW